MAKKVPAYCLHRASGKAVVRIGGRDHYLGQHGTAESKRAYKRLISEWESSGRGTTFGLAKSQTTVAMLWADYRAHCDAYYPPTANSEAVHTRKAFEFMAEYLDVPVREFGPRALKAVRDKMLEATGAHGKPLSRRYINRQLDRIRRAFRWGVEEEMIEPNIYEALRAVAGLKLGRTTAPEPPKVTAVPDSVVDATLPHLTSVVASMVKLQQLTGMRPGEVCSLTPSMIDTSSEVWVANIVAHKTAYRGAERTVYIGPRAQEILKPYLAREADAHLFSPAEAEAERRAKLRAARVTPLSCGNSTGTNVLEKPTRQPGTRYTTHSYGRSVGYGCAKQWPIPDGASREEAAAWRERWWWTPNQLRHAAATRARRDYGIEAAQVLLGHSEIAVTQVYAEKNLEAGKRIALQIG